MMLMRALLVSLLAISLTGCVADAIRANKGQGVQFYSKSGATWESRQADWDFCGGGGIWWNPVWEDASKARVCMTEKGYHQSLTAGEPSQ